MSNCVDDDMQQRNAPLITVDMKQLTQKRERVVAPRCVERWLLRVNHWFWLLAATWGGRIALQIVGFAWAIGDLRHRGSHIIGLLVHYTWLVSLIRARSCDFPVVGGVALGPWFAGLTTFLISGLLHIQLLMNHASRPMNTENDPFRKSLNVDWVSWQAEATADIRCPRWADWFHGGLQFQITHHLFPRLRADRLRAASEEVYKMLDKHGQEVTIYDGFSGGVAAVTRQLVSACREAGHTPWLAWGCETKDGRALQMPNLFWTCVHVGLIFIMPFLRLSDFSFFGAWVLAFGVFLTLLFAPLAAGTYI